jgi:hypothetical protein
MTRLYAALVAALLCLAALPQTTPAQPTSLMAVLSGGSASEGGGDPDPEPMATSWIGIPDPSSYMGYDALNVTEPADPSGWSSGPVTGYYYICPDGEGGTSTDTGNTYGWPGVPRETPPASVTLAAGTGKIVFSETCSGFTNWNETNADEITISGDGVQGESQVWVVGRCNTACTRDTAPQLLNAQILISSDDAVIAYLRVASYNYTNHTSDSGLIHCTGERVTLKHFDFEGDSSNHSTGPIVIVPCNGMVVYDGYCHDFGDWQASTENDYHCYKTSSGHHHWILEMDGDRNSGDTWQAGGSGDPEGTGCSFVYIGGGTTTSGLENGGDIKTCDDVVVSGVTVTGMRANAGVQANGEGIVVHDNPRRVTILNSTLCDNDENISVTGGRAIAIIGNVLCEAIDEGLNYRNTIDESFIAYNTFYDNPTHIDFEALNGGTATISNNIFGARSNPAATGEYDIDFTNSTLANAQTIDRNMYSSLRVNRSGAVTSLAAMQALGDETNGQVADATFVNAAARNFRLQAGSDGIDDGDESGFFDWFFGLYSIDAAFDADGSTRPTGTGFDVGAFEYAP